MKRHILYSILSVFFLATIYGQVIHHSFINFDDPDYVTENQHVQQGLTQESISWAFSLYDNDLTYWQPMAYIAHMVDVELFGMNSGAHHLSNLVIHFINVLLLYMALVMMTGSVNKSGLIALIFAVHPIGVDSVAWISQKKTLLSTTFWLLSIIGYARYSIKSDKKSYLSVLLFVALGLLTKPILVTIPLVFMILDVWPLQRWKRIRLSARYVKPLVRNQYDLKRLVFEKIPFMILVALWGITPFIPKHVMGMKNSLDLIPLELRIKNALVSYFSYLKKLIWPADLSFLYPYPDTVALYKTILACLCLSLFLIIAIKKIKTRPYLATGWFLFMVVLVPFLGLVQGAVWPAYADRFAYVPFMGLYILAIWAGEDVVRRFSIPSVVYVPLLGIWLVVLSMISYRQTGYWKDDVSLYTHALKVSEKNYIAYNNLGIAYDKQGRHDEARKQYYLSLWAKPGYSQAYYNLGINYLGQGNLNEAKKEFDRSLKSNPINPKALYNLGTIAMDQQSPAEAEAYYKKALSQKNDFYQAYNNLGVLYWNQGRLLDAATHFKMALSYNPYHIEALCNLGNVLFDMNRPNDAEMCFLRALSIDEKNIKAMNDLAVVYSSMGQLIKAQSLFQAILSIDPGNSSAIANLQLVKKGTQSVKDAYDRVKGELKHDPENTDKQIELARMCLALNNRHDAESIYLDILSRDAVHKTAITELAQLYEESGEYQKAVIYYTKLAEISPDQEANAFYSLACMFALEGQSDTAVAWLQKAADSGFSNWETLKTDSRLNLIRSSPLFLEFIKIAGL